MGIKEEAYLNLLRDAGSLWTTWVETARQLLPSLFC